MLGSTRPHGELGIEMEGKARLAEKTMPFFPFITSVSAHTGLQ